MTSFAVRIEPAAQPRLAAVALLLHLTAALMPWIARCPPGIAAILCAVALAGLPATLGSVPGRHNRLRRLQLVGEDWRAWLEPGGPGRRADVEPGSRVWRGLVSLALRIDGRRRIWLLPRGSLPACEFRRLKARVRLAARIRHGSQKEPKSRDRSPGTRN